MMKMNTHSIMSAQPAHQEQPLKPEMMHQVMEHPVSMLHVKLTIISKIIAVYPVQLGLQAKGDLQAVQIQPAM